MNSTNFESFFPMRNRSSPERTSLPPPRKRRLFLPDSTTPNHPKPPIEEAIEEFDSPPRISGKKWKLHLPDNPPPPRIQNENEGHYKGDFVIQQPEPHYQDHGVDCIRVSDVFEKSPFQTVFPYPQFNAMQSQCFADAFRTDDSLVVSAPTGGGKTVIFELAICRTFSQNRSQSSQKVLYVAPLKALVQERKDDWAQKFQSVGLTCAELTSDTSETLELNQIQNSEILLCTPEKWDQLTRQNNTSKLVSNISLVLLDEVHVLTENRGACLEAIVTRMKLWSHWNKQEGNLGIRFLALSATCPNLVDIGNWLGVPPDTGVKKFGDEYRPVPLRVIVERVQETKNQFLWDRNLKFRIFSIIKKYSDSKPTLVVCFSFVKFCSSRKSAVDAALQVISDSMGFNNSPAQTQALRSAQIKDKSLSDCILHGVGFYHAALSIEDRQTIQKLFLSGYLRVVCSTSGLAMGVNLPAHLVIICGTKFYRSSSYVDIDSITIMQMIGRAGRPQFDTSAVAVILTDGSGDKKYQKMVEGLETIESSLHRSLAEHFNSEIVLRTIRSMEDAIAWVKCTFLYVRLQIRPEYYQDKISSNNLSEKKLEEWVRYVLDDMRTHGLILQANGELFATKLGKTLCNHRTNYATMKLFAQVEQSSDFYAIIRLLCSATEFENVVLRRGEKRALNELNKNDKIVRFSVGKLVRNSIDKVCILFQAFFSDHKFDDWGLRTEAAGLLPPSLRIIRCMITFFEEKKLGVPLLHAIRLSQCLDSHIWYDSTLVCRQLEGIGATLAKNLAQGNIVSFSDLENANPRRIEILLKRNPPAGNLLQANLEKIWPKTLLSVQVAIEDTNVKMIISVQSENTSDCDRHKFRGMFSRVLVLQERKNLLLFTARTKNFCIRPSNFTVYFPLSKVEDDPEVIIYVLNENYVGLDVAQVIHLMEEEETYETIVNPGATNRNTETIVNPGATNRNTERKKKEDRLGGLCKHTCKHKAECKHACCKKWIEHLPPTVVEENPERCPERCPELDLLREKATEQTTTRFCSVHPSETSEISHQIASYREEIDFLNQETSPPLTHKEPEIYLPKEMEPQNEISTLAETSRRQPNYDPRKLRVRTPQNIEIQDNIISPAKTTYDKEDAPVQVQRPRSQTSPFMMPRQNQRPFVPVSCPPRPRSCENRLPHLTEYMQQKQEREFCDENFQNIEANSRFKSVALSNYCKQISHPHIASRYQPSGPPAHWGIPSPLVSDSLERESGIRNAAFPFGNQSVGMGSWKPERWEGSELGGGSFLSEEGNQIRGMGMRRRQVHENIGGARLLNLQRVGEQQGDECGLSHNQQNGKYCPECGKRLR